VNTPQAGCVKIQDHASIRNNGASLQLIIAARLSAGETDASCGKVTHFFPETHHRGVPGLLVLEDAPLGCMILFHTPVAIHVIGRKIEPDRHIGTKGLNGLELEGGQFQGNCLRVIVSQNNIGKRAAVITTCFTAHPFGPYHALHQLGGGGLSVGARDTHHAPLIESRGKLGLPYEFPGPLGKGLREFTSRLDTRTDHHQISLAAPTRLRGRSGLTGNLRRHAREGPGRGRIVEGDRPTLAQRQLRGSPTTPSGSQDRNFLTSEIHFVKLS